MAKKNIKTTKDLESRITALKKRMAILEQLSKKLQRKKSEYTVEEKVAIRARLLAGQEAAHKRRENELKANTEPKQVAKARSVPLAKTS